MVGERVGERPNPVKHANGEILVLEDDPEIGMMLAARAAQHFDRPVVIADSLEQARAYLDENTPAIALLDMLLSDGDGTELLGRLERDGVDAVAVVTGAPSMYRATLALRVGAVDFLVKPFRDEQLVGMFQRIERRLGERQETAQLKHRLAKADENQEALRLRIDILCKDLVDGYQKLVLQMTRRNP
jgi:DNA-binding response OmpR family regulator